MSMIECLLSIIFPFLCFISILYELVTDADEYAKIFARNKLKQLIYISGLYFLFISVSFNPIHQSSQFKYLNNSLFLLFFIFYFGFGYIFIIFRGSRINFFNGPSDLWKKYMGGSSIIWKSISFFLAAKEFCSLIASKADSVFSYFISSAG